LKPQTHKYLKPISDLIVTLLLWSYFTLGFIVLFSPFYLGAYLFAANREFVYQRLNHNFYKGFFLLVRALIPGQKWHIAKGGLQPPVLPGPAFADFIVSAA
jgi:1-acyl-sn-glycerol-3-phosphate acyltransferase